MDAIIIAGGKGNRMDDPKPKALVNAKGKTILAWQIDHLLGFGVEKIVLALGYKSDEVIGYIKSNYNSQAISWTVETAPIGTAGAIKLALKKTTAEFILVLNCDDVTDIDIKKIMKLQENTICAAHPQLPFGLITEKDGFAEFKEKPILNEWVSCGWYLLNRNDMLKILPDKGMLEYDVFPKMKLKVYKHEGFWKPLNTKKDIIEFENMQY
jgi:NDP-sugar pyrophosphorylase family protein